MHSSRKITKLKRISIIPFLLGCIPIVFIYLFLRDLPLLNSLFVDYVNSGTSIFFPFLPYSNIVFNFSTSHLIDIIIIINIIGSVERTGYHYYMNVCLKKDYIDLYLESFFLETNETQEELYLNSDLILSLKEDSDTLVNECSGEYTLYQKSRIKANYFSNKSGYNSRIFKMKHKYLNFLYDSNKKYTQHKNNYTIYQKFSTNNVKNYHFPSKNNNIFSNFFENFHQEEGR